MGKARDSVELARTSVNDSDIGTSVLSPTGDSSGLLNLYTGQIPSGNDLPDPVWEAGYSFHLFQFGKGLLYVSNGTSWDWVGGDTSIEVSGPYSVGGLITLERIPEGDVTYLDAASAFLFRDDAPLLAYELYEGSIPVGSSLDLATGIITGTSTLYGTYAFTIKATNTSGGVAYQNYSWIVDADAPQTVGGLITLAQANGGTAQTYDASADFVFGPMSVLANYTISSGLMPGGMALNASTGLISGTVDDVTLINTFTVTATDTDGDTGDQDYYWLTNIAVKATGGTVTTMGMYKVHTFTTGGTLELTQGGVVEILIVGGGGTGGGGSGGGGGGGGSVYHAPSMVMATGSYPIVVGASVTPGNGYNSTMKNGITTSAFSIDALGGGAGASSSNGNAGANGGGALGTISTTNSGGDGAINYYGGWDNYGGFDGASNSVYRNGAGGAGASEDGQPIDGGDGVMIDIVGPYYWGGGGGSAGRYQGGNGGKGGGGGGAGYEYLNGLGDTNGIDDADDGVLGGSNSAGGDSGLHTGGGGGGAYAWQYGGDGSAGIVIVKYLA
jgi:hypothetical protein